MQNKDIGLLEKNIGYTFRDKHFLNEALTHSSYANEMKTKKMTSASNERLEFLGDAVIESITSDYLFIEYPDYSLFLFRYPTKHNYRKMRSLFV